MIVVTFWGAAPPKQRYQTIAKNELRTGSPCIASCRTVSARLFERKRSAWLPEQVSTLLASSSENMLINNRITAWTFVGCLTIGIAWSAIAQAQPASDQTASTPNTASSRQMQKAQRKAQRKANREKKNAELRELEKNGFNPAAAGAANQTEYPQNLQNAQQKINAQKQGAKPASAP
jgi:hypothetical protein